MSGMSATAGVVRSYQPRPLTLLDRLLGYTSAHVEYETVRCPNCGEMIYPYLERHMVGTIILIAGLLILILVLQEVRLRLYPPRRKR